MTVPAAARAMKLSVWADAAILPGMAVYAYAVFPFAADGPSLCLWLNLTGHRCPGCGLTHAVCHAFRGDFAAAWEANALVAFALPVLAWLSIRAWADLWKIRRRRCGRRAGEGHGKEDGREEEE